MIFNISIYFCPLLYEELEWGPGGGLLPLFM